jgi:tetratricopeptide (TPR) repeat protein
VFFWPTAKGNQATVSRSQRFGSSGLDNYLSLDQNHLGMSVTEKRFRIAFSFAGEVREFVEKTANILAAQFGQDKILYDKFHESEFARWNLGIYLPKFYGEQSDLIVAVHSPDYNEKRWTGWEWVHIYGLLTKADGHRVLTSRFKYAEADGLSPAAGFIELDDKTPEQFVDTILERLALNEGKPKGHYKKQGTEVLPQTTIPNNLPALQPFFGREEELETIAEALDPESRTWGAIIDGPGGMGKTSLAVRAALDASSEVFDRIVFISLKPRELDDDGIRDLSGFLISGLAELLNELARELGCEDIPKALEEERPKRLIEALRNQRVLLILDNLESLVRKERDTVFNFVKRLPSGCKAILTSRGRIGSAGEELILSQLNEDATQELLAEIAKRNPALAKSSMEDRRQLWEITGGNPLLIRWTAGQVGRRKCLTLNDAVAYLRTCPPGNDPLEFIFGDLVEDFSLAETKALCALTYFTLPAKTKHLATVGECSEEEMDGALRSLINRSLVRPDEEVTSFTLVPLVADYLRKKRPEAIAETGNTLEKSAYALVLENGYQRHDCFPVLEESWSMVAAALPLFVHGANSRLQEVCDALPDFLDFTGRWDEWMKLSSDAEKRAVVNGAFYNAGWRAYDMGYIYFLRRQPPEVFAWAVRTEEHWEKAKVGTRERAIVLRLRGMGYGMNEEYEKAVEAYQESLRLFRTLGENTQSMANIQNDLGDVKRRLQQYDDAVKHSLEALRIAKIIRDEEGISTYTGNLASLRLHQENWLAAEQLAREALTLGEKVGRQELIAVNNHRIAEALLRQVKKADALPYARRAVDIYQQLGSPDLKEALDTLTECEV